MTSINKKPHQPLLSLPLQLKTQSTIYRRHEARLMRSFALKDDARPAMVRVLSLLPGFSYLIPQHAPARDTRAPAGQPSMPAIGEYSEETLYSSTDCGEDGHTIKQTSSTPTNSSVSTSYRLPGLALATSAAAAAAAAVAPGAVEALRQHQAPSTVRNPFDAASQHGLAVGRTTATSSFSARPSMTGMSLTLQHVLMTRPAASASLLSTIVQPASSSLPFSKSPLPVTAASVGLLFGTRHIFESILLPRQDGGTTSSSSSSSSAAVAGIVASLPMALHQRILLGAPTTSSQLSLFLARHSMAGVVYFGVWDYYYSTNTDSHKTLWKTAVVGAVAGSLGAALTAPRTIVRAAPIHALVWCAYDTLMLA